MIALIDAGPGTGKTYSLINGYLSFSQQLLRPLEPTEEQSEIFKFMKEEFSRTTKTCFFAHGKEIKKKLVKNLKSTPADVHTLHGMGMSVLIKQFGFQKLVYDRTDKFIENHIGRKLTSLSFTKRREYTGIKRLCHYLKTEDLDASQESLDYLLLKYGDLSSYSLPENWEALTSYIMEASAIPDRTVEFCDQPWLGKKYARFRYDLGLVDESQDIFRCTYRLLTKVCRNVIFCGDRNQAIMAFAGASEEMYDHIKSRSDAVFPLKVTQRCPPKVCDYANEVRPGGVLPGPNVFSATIKSIPKRSLPELLSPPLSPENTLLVSRTNATIINCAIWLHTQGIPFNLVDKDLKDEITKFIKMFKPASLGDLKQKLRAWLTRAERVPNDFYVQSCTDKYNYISAIIAQCKSLPDINRFLEVSFSDRVPGFKLTTCHKAKGLEAHNVVILSPPIPLSFAKDHPIAWDQELNLDFVARTRSSGNIYLVV